MTDPVTIARVCHEANRALQAAQADPAIPVAAPWEECGPEMQASAIDGVETVLAGADSRASHENWARFKLRQGWTYGPVKNESLKQHPLLVDYDQLPDEQRFKDHLFCAIVNTLAGTRTDEQNDRYQRAKARFFTATEQPAVVALRDQIIALGMVIEEHVPPGRNQAIAYTALEDVQMRANRGIFAPESLR